MEKSEGRKPKPSSSSHRAYSLFSSIINLSTSQGVKTTDISSPQSTHSSPITSTNHHHQQRVSSSSSSNVSKKKKSNQSSSTTPKSQSIVSHPGTGLGSSPNTLMGPAPRTVSILTALNELANSSSPSMEEQTGVVQSNTHTNSHNISLQHGARVNMDKPHQNDGSLSSGGSVSSEGRRRLRQVNRLSSSHHQLSTSTSTTKLKRDDLPPLPPSSSSSTFSNSMPRRKLVSDKDPTSQQHHAIKTRSKSKDRTPDWITKIFQQAKHGRLDELQQSLKNLDPLDPTLLRHLVDGKGNTLLHCAARGGHVVMLQWLLTIMGPHTEAVLSDKNRAGRNVILTALKGGQLQCFQWLVLCGNIRLVPKEGEMGRSLLHYAASYGNDAAVKWLSEQLNKRNIELDSLKDSSGLTPLHMGGKSGSLPVCHELIAAGASPLCQTEFGWRPSDLALRHHHKECANYLMMAEAADSLGQELYGVLHDYKDLRQEHDSLRLNFREVLRVGKWLVKERVDLIKSFPSLASKSSPEATVLLGGASGNSTRISGLEHKLVKAEQEWKRIEQNHNQDKILSPPSSSSPMSPNSSFLGENMESTMSNLTNPDLLQKRLGSLQSRRDNNFTSEAFLSASSSSEASSSASDVTSSDDDHSHSHYERQGVGQQQTHRRHHGEEDLKGTKEGVNRFSNSTRTAPWLLPPDDSLLSALTPIVSQLDSTSGVTTMTTTVGTLANPFTCSSMMEMIPNLDLLRIAPSSNNNNNLLLSKPGIGPGGKNESSELRFDGRFLQQQQQSPLMQLYSQSHESEEVTPSAAVLEVIEPHRTPSKTVYFTSPDLIRGTRPKDKDDLKRSTTNSPSVTSMTKMCSISNKSGGLENIYGDMNGRCQNHEGTLGASVTTSSSPSSSMIMTAKTFSPSPLSITSTSGWMRGGGGGGVMEGMSSTKTKIASSACISPIIPSANNSMSNSPRSSSQSTFILQAEPFTFDDEDEDEKETVNESRHGGVSFGSTENNLPSTSSPSSSVSFNLNQMTYSVILPPQSVLPSGLASEKYCLESSSFNSDTEKRKQEKGHAIDIGTTQSCEIPRSNLVVPNDSVSSSNTPVMTRSLSSISRTSTTVLFPLEKAPWLSTELLAPSCSSTTSTPSSCGGRLSPSPSEASRTESALVPPSHTSQNSEVSKTESAMSANEQPPTPNFLLERIDIDSMEEDEHEGNIDDNTNSPQLATTSGQTQGKVSDYNSTIYNPKLTLPSSSGIGESSAGTIEIGGTKSNNVLHFFSKESQPDVELEMKKKQDSSSSSPSTSQCTTTPSIQTAPCIIRPRISTVKTIQRAKTRGPPKPWYEIDGSEEEEESLLRVSRNSRSSCLSSSTTNFSSPPRGPSTDNDNKDESTLQTKDDDSTPPPPPSSCPPRHNSPDFV